MRRSGRGPVHVLILAAGRGKRMRSGTVKMLHRIGGAPMVWHVARAASRLRPALMAAVVGRQAAEVSAALQDDTLGTILFIEQAKQLGTAHAVMQAEKPFRSWGARRGTLLILNGDVPLIRTSTLRALLARHRRTGAAGTIATTLVEDPAGYGRVVRDGKGEFAEIVEHRDATPRIRKIREVNAGLYCVEIEVLFAALRKTGRSNAQGEYYLPDLFPILRTRGHRIEVYRHVESEEVLGVNDRAELSRAGKILYRRRGEDLMGSGVTILDPDSAWIDPWVRVGKDTVIHPMAHLEGRTSIGTGCTIGAQTRIVDSTLGRGVVVRDVCVISESTIRDGVTIGPFAHLRPGTILEEGSRVGNFVEVKKSRLGRGSKAPHLTYLGDAEIGERCNIGAGTITCNYDGVRKNVTILEDDVFVGSDTQLVAPVRVRRGAYVGAGSTITKEVPEDSLAMTRSPQKTIRGWALRRRKRK